MSRAKREIESLQIEVATLRLDRAETLARLQDERGAIRAALAQHPACPRCGALQAALDAARETINDLARERPP